jgi:hypothetical protein
MALIGALNMLVQSHNLQVATLMEQLDSALKDPKVGAEIALKQQAERMKRESK